MGWVRVHGAHNVCFGKTNILYILGRIVGGVDVEEGMIPWQVGLASSTLTRPFCGGSVIDKFTVVTAAHCVTETNE